MIQEPHLYPGLKEAMARGGKITLYCTNGVKFNAIVTRLASEYIELIIDDADYESDFAENGDKLCADYDNIQGFEYR